MGGRAKNTISAIANSVFGTWHLPAGLELPDVDSAQWTRKLHKILTKSANRKVLASTRIGLAGLFKFFATVKNRAGDDLSTEKTSGVQFYSDKGKVIKRPSKSIFFPGSGIDRIRNFDTGIRDLQSYMRALLGQKSPKLEDGPIADEVRGLGLEETHTYLYQTQSASNLSSAWFQRLQDAYRLNISPSYVSAEAREFVTEFFLPRISEDSEGEGRIKIDPEQAADNMRYTLAGQSYGGTFLQMVVNALYENMRDLGYDNDQIQIVFDNILIFNISGAAFASNLLERPSPKTLFVEHKLDFVGFQTDRHDVHPYFNEGHQNSTNQGIRLSDRRQFYWLNFKWRDDRTPDGVIKPQEDVYGYHDLRGVLSDLPPPVLAAMRSSLGNTTRLPELKDLLDTNAVKPAHVQQPSID